ncbi:MAG: DUF72 domain-containing protein [Phycisphaerales bacterium]
MADLRVGISGWTFAPWRGNFYPKGLTQKRELAYASRRFNALEINGTFYSLQRPESFRNWYEQTPPGFVFTLKGPEYLTHKRRLKEPLQPLANFFASGVLGLREKLGAILWQLPPNMIFDKDRVAEFLDLLPHDTTELVRLAKKHDSFVEGHVELETDAKRPVRHAVEFRHESFMTEPFVDLLRKHNVAMVIADAASKFPTAEDVTADWIYVRLHGARELDETGYTPREIAGWAGKIRAWSKGGEPPDPRRIGGKAPAAKSGRDVYTFFDNTAVKLRSPVDARRMVEELGAGPSESIEQVLNELGAQSKTVIDGTQKAKAPRKKTAIRKRP